MIRPRDMRTHQSSVSTPLLATNVKCKMIIFPYIIIKYGQKKYVLIL